MGLAVGRVQIKECARKGGRVCSREAHVSQGRGRAGKDWIGKCLAHVAHQTRLVTRLQFGYIKAEFLCEAEDNRCGHRAVVVFHLVEVG